MITNELSEAVAMTAKNPALRQCPFCAETHPALFLTAPDRFHGREKEYELLRCSSCSLVWLNAPPAPPEMGEHYGEEYDRTIAIAAKAPDHWYAPRDVLFRYKSGGSVLDLGCASGGFLSTVKGPAWQLFGIEMSEEAAEIARHRCGAQVFVGDILDAHFPRASFDAITCFNVFEHVYEPQKVLARVAEWLKPGGIFIAAMPNIDSAGERIFRSYWYGLELPRHLYHFSPKTLRMVAESVGLHEISLSTARCLHFESSMRYVVDNLVKKIGISRPPLSRATEPGIAFKVVRKIFRMTFLNLFSASAFLIGDGEVINAVFTKPDASQ